MEWILQSWKSRTRILSFIYFHHLCYLFDIDIIILVEMYFPKLIDTFIFQISYWSFTIIIVFFLFLMIFYKNDRLDSDCIVVLLLLLLTYFPISFYQCTMWRYWCFISASFQHSHLLPQREQNSQFYHRKSSSQNQQSKVLLSPAVLQPKTTTCENKTTHLQRIWL